MSEEIIISVKNLTTIVEEQKYWANSLVVISIFDIILVERILKGDESA